MYEFSIEEALGKSQVCRKKISTENYIIDVHFDISMLQYSLLFSLL